MIRSSAIAFCTFITLAGCVEDQGVAGTDYDNRISTLTILCNSHYPFTQDCSNWVGAKRKLEIEGFRVNVAATGDGQTILVMDPDGIARKTVNVFGALNKEQNKASNNSFEAVQKVLLRNGVRINRVLPLTSMGSIDGYILELSKEGYSYLKPYTVK
ncbi:hypothetical protein [Parasulfitobacter algicola]|uniref:Lipoprotein n=1 Tax=Parasulfitobacter algicola TaxID=2614809 RepID=A0ABX2IS74_9RHOB|nr:hypothetical protein [Sulfitobacter algicola]NSX53632.1 hypothetical protein [Sulfitobacter algicola]